MKKNEISSTLTLESFKQNKLLREVCTFAIGGPARYFHEVRSVEEMQNVLIFCFLHKLPYFVLGKGSNSLFDDRGFDGLVISNKIDFFESPSPGLFHVGAGYSFSLLGVQTARQHWAGLEFASGIPASVGGAVFMNAGANGSETCQALISVDYVTHEGTFICLKKSELHFAYRTSSFQKMRGAIVGATFALKHEPEARNKQFEIINYRKKTQPYGDKSAGCVFRNPECGHAGALIDRAGLKNSSIGDAKISEMHANFIVNSGQASSQDVIALIKHVQNRVSEQFNITLESEVRVVPYQQDTHE